MATRFYLPSTGTTPAFTPTPRGWNTYSGTGQGTPQKLVTTKTSSAQAYTQVSSDTTATIRYHMVRQFVSDPLAAQTISGTLTASIKAYESATGLNACLSIGVYLIDSTGAYKSTLLLPNQATDVGGGTPYEFTTTAGSRRLYNTSESLGCSLSSQTAAAGDRLVVEIGYSEVNATASRYARLYFGDDAANDLDYAEGDTGVDNSWIEFSGTISFPVLTQIAGTIDVTTTATGLAGLTKQIAATIGSSSTKNLLGKNTANGCENGTTSGWAAGASATITADNTAPYSGSYALKRVSTTSGDAAALWPDTPYYTPISAGLNYVASARWKGTGNERFQISLYDAAYGWLSTDFDDYTASGSYTQIVTGPLSNASAAYITIDKFSPQSTGTQTAYFDEVQIEQNSAPTAWEEPGIIPGITVGLTGEATVSAGPPLIPLTGTITVSTTATASQANIARTVAGTVGISTTVSSLTSNVSRPVAGTIGITTGLTGSASVLRTVAGSLAIQTGDTGLVNITRSVQGVINTAVTVPDSNSRIALAATGAIPIQTGFNGSISAVYKATGTVDVLTGLAGASRVLYGARGTVDVLTGLTGASIVTKNLQGTINVQTTLPGANALRTMSTGGTVDISTTLTSTINISRTVQGVLTTTVGVPNIQANIWRGVAGSIDIVTGLSGLIRGAPLALMGSIAIETGNSALAAMSRTVAGTITIQTGTLGDITKTGLMELAGDITINTTTTAAAEMDLSGAGNIAITTGLTGLSGLNRLALGNIDITTGLTAAASILGIVQLAGTITVTTNLPNSNIRLLLPATGTVDITTTATAAARLTRLVGGTVNITTTLGGPANILRTVTGTAGIITGTTAAATLFKGLTGSLAVSTSLSGSVKNTLGASGNVAITVATLANITGTFQLAGNLAIITSTSANIDYLYEMLVEAKITPREPGVSILTRNPGLRALGSEGTASFTAKSPRVHKTVDNPKGVFKK